MVVVVVSSSIAIVLWDQSINILLFVISSIKLCIVFIDSIMNQYYCLVLFHSTWYDYHTKHTNQILELKQGVLSDRPTPWSPTFNFKIYFFIFFSSFLCFLIYVLSLVFSSTKPFFLPPLHLVFSLPSLSPYFSLVHVRQTHAKHQYVDTYRNHTGPAADW